MKPIVLQMTAFGPYAKTETIDFKTGLKERKMFLIHGATGAGKTSILDGICYALYGVLSVKSKALTSIRSDFSTIETITSVEFTFEISKKRYKIVRKPKQVKIKVNGKGETTMEQDVTLYEIIQNEEKPIADGVRPVDVAIVDIIGFNVDQFRQVIILPQGEFKKVLEATTNERNKILADLFETAIFDRFEKFFLDKSKTVENEVKLIEQSINEKLISQSVTNTGELQKLIDDNTVLLTTLDSELKQNNEMLSLKKENLKIIEENNKLVSELEIAEREYKTLLNKSDYFADLKKSYDSGQKVKSLLPYEEHLISQKNELKELTQSIDACRTDLNSKKEKLSEIQSQLSVENAKKNDIEQMKIRLEKIKSLIQKEDEQTILIKQNDDLIKELKELETSLQTKIRGIDDCKVAIENLSKKTSELDKETLVSNLNRLSTRHKEIKLNIEYLHQSLEIQDTIKKAGVFLDAEKKKEKDSLVQIELLETKLAEKNAELFKQSAFHLAEHLENGQPCPVCGSKEHPAVAKAFEANNVEADIKKITVNISEAKKILESTRIKIMEKSGIIESYKGTLSQVNALLSKESDTSGLESEAITIAREIEETNKKIEDSNKNTALLESRKSDEERLKGEKETLIEKTNKVKIELKGLESKLYEISKNFADADIQGKSPHKEAGFIENSITVFEEKLKKLFDSEKKYLAEQSELSGQFEALTKNHAEKEKKNIADKEEFVNKYKKLGFTSDQDYWNKKIDEKTLIEYEKQINNFNEQLLLKESQFNILHKQSGGKTIIDSSQLINDIKSIQIMIDEKLQEKGSISKTVEYQKKEFQSILNFQVNYETVKKKWEIIDSLFKIISGKIGKVPFKSYLLITILDEVLVTSNERLKIMSKGRYVFVREDSNDGQGYHGLDIAIFDSETGKNRSVSTLSGGEGFIASLSLAMGLADCIQSYCGNREMDTIFIDEGFGSLDPQSLDKAIKTLNEINAQGRLVGIISHVEELKTRFNDCRLEVIKTNNGSKAEFFVF